MGVLEYLVWRSEDETIDWWQLEDGEYLPLAPDERGLVRSVVFPGLAIDIPALLEAARAALEAGDDE